MGIVNCAVGLSRIVTSNRRIPRLSAKGDTDGQGQRPEAVIVPSTHEEELVRIDISEVAWDEVGENGICE
jgi:hypothetical protein